MHHLSWMDGRSCLKSSFNNKYRRVTGKASSTLLYFCQRAAYRRFGGIHPGFVTMIDTGTTQVVGEIWDPRTIQAIYDQIPGS
jgi:hypothetical protein